MKRDTGVTQAQVPLLLASCQVSVDKPFFCASSSRKVRQAKF